MALQGAWLHTRGCSVTRLTRARVGTSSTSERDLPGPRPGAPPPAPPGTRGAGGGGSSQTEALTPPCSLTDIHSATFPHSHRCTWSHTRGHSHTHTDTVTHLGAVTYSGHSHIHTDMLLHTQGHSHTPTDIVTNLGTGTHTHSGHTDTCTNSHMASGNLAPSPTPCRLFRSRGWAAGPHPLPGSPEGRGWCPCALVAPRSCVSPLCGPRMKVTRAQPTWGFVGRAYHMSTDPEWGVVTGTPPGERTRFTSRQSSPGIYGAHAHDSAFTCPPSSKRHLPGPPPPCGGLHDDPSLCHPLTPKPGIGSVSTDVIKDLGL